MSDTFRPVAALCAYAGLRASEALGLRWHDIDFNNSTLTVTGQLGMDGERRPAKTATSMATLPLLPALERILLEHRRRVVANARVTAVVYAGVADGARERAPQSCCRLASVPSVERYSTRLPSLAV
jgi:integrase